MKKTGTVLVIVLLIIGSILYVKRRDIQYMYFYLMDMVMDIGIDRTYYIYIKLSDDVVFNNGIEDILLPKPINKETLFNSYTKKKPYYGIFSNSVIAASGYHNEYEIEMNRGTEFRVVSTSEEPFLLRYHMYFRKNEWCRDVDFSGVECKEFKAEVQQDHIRCYTDTSFGVDTYIFINLNYKEYYTGFLFHDVDFEIKSFEIRKRENDKPMIYLDMDGDGVYEKDCSEYLNELDYYY